MQASFEMAAGLAESDRQDRMNNDVVVSEGLIPADKAPSRRRCGGWAAGKVQMQ